MRTVIITITILFSIMAAGEAFGQGTKGADPKKFPDNGCAGNCASGKGVKMGRVIAMTVAGDRSLNTSEASGIDFAFDEPYSGSRSHGDRTQPTARGKTGPKTKANAYFAPVFFQDEGGSISYRVAKKRRPKK